jgi:hypothetical protein
LGEARHQSPAQLPDELLGIANEFELPKADDIDANIEKAGLEALEYGARWGVYRLSLHKDDLTKHRALLKELMQAAYQNRAM